MKGAIYHVAIAKVIFSHVKISSFRTKAHLVFIDVYIINYSISYQNRSNKTRLEKKVNSDNAALKFCLPKAVSCLSYVRFNYVRMTCIIYALAQYNYEMLHVQ